MDNVSEKRWLPYYRRGGNKDHHKEIRLSKDSIGQPMKLEKNGRFSNVFDSADVPGASSAHHPSMMMKCIIVHPDESGYGLTVSGDNPVFIQSVKEGGAAAKAGVVEGDRILKVNGDGVKNLNHTEVVKLIKEKSYVVLTLLGDSAKTVDSSNEILAASQPQSTDAKSSPQITKHPNVFYDQKIETIKKMLEQEKAEVERIKEEYARDPDEKIIKALAQAEKLKRDLEKQLWRAESMKEKNLEITASASMTSSTSDLDVTGSTDHLSGDAPPSQAAEDNTGDGAASDVAARLKRAPVAIDSGDQQDATMVVASEDHSTQMERPNNAIPTNLFPDLGFSASKCTGASGPPSQQMDIMNFEDDDDILAECDSNHGPFSDFETLRQRPPYLAVFLNYVIDSRDPANFLLYIAVDYYKTLSSSKEMVKLGDVIYKTYLAPDSALKTSVDERISHSIHNVLTPKSHHAEEALRGVFDPAVQHVRKEIENQLSTFRKKREQGVAYMYGDEIVQQAIRNDSNQSEYKLVEEILTPTLNKLSQATCVDEIDQARNVIKIEAINSFLAQYGSKKPKKASRIYSKLSRSKPNSMIKPSRISGSMDSIMDEKDKRLSGIGQLFGVKKVEKTKAKVEKPKANERGGSKREKRASRRHTIRDNPPPIFATFLKPQRVSSSVSADQLSAVATSSGASGDSQYSYASRPKSVPFEGSLMTIETHSVTVHPPPELHEASYSFHQVAKFGSHGEENVDNPENDVTVSTNSLHRGGSIRRHGDQQKHGSHKSHSDPDKNKVEQAVVQHNTASPDQAELNSLHISPDSSHGSFSEDKRLSMHLPSITDEEIGIDVSEQQWSVPKSVAKSMDKKEIKRQQIIDELIFTEQHHVRNLKILEKLYYEPLYNNSILTREELNQAFANLKEILQLHRELNRWLQELKETDGHVVKNIGDVLLARFDGNAGDTFKNECATYCGNQFTVLSLIKEKTKKDRSFNEFLEAAQKHPISRKLHLKDFIPMEFQRLTKYPLLLDNIVKHTKKKQESEIKKVKMASERCREILTFVNQAVKQAEDLQTIIEIEKTLDREPLLKFKASSETVHEFKNMDLKERTIIHQGALTWKFGQADKRKSISVHCILYDNVMVLLQKQDDRYILRCHEGQGTGVHDPFISMQRAHVSTVATDKRAFFVVSYVSAQMYEFAATSNTRMKEWMSIIVKTAKNETPASSMIRRRAGLSIAISPTPDAPETHDDVVETHDDVVEKSDDGILAGELIGHADKNHPEIEQHDEEEVELMSPSTLLPTPEYSNPSIPITSRILMTQQEITNALATKHRLLAELSNLEDAELDQMLDMCTVDDEPDPVVLVRHAVLCADRLAGMINESTSSGNSFVKKRKVEEDSKRLSVGFNLPPDFQNEFSEGNTEKWATTLPNPILTPEKSPVMETVSSGTLNSVSDLPLSESEPILSPGSDSQRDSKPFSYVANEEPKFDLRPSSDQPLSPNLAQMSSVNPLHRVSETLSIDALLSRTGSDPSSSNPSRPSSGVELWMPRSDFPIVKMIETVSQLQTQLTRLMHVTEENDKERLILLAENQRLKETLEDSQNAAQDESSPPPYDESIQ